MKKVINNALLKCSRRVSEMRFSFSFRLSARTGLRAERVVERERVGRA